MTDNLARSTTKRKFLSIVVHASAYFFLMPVSILVPVFILLLSNDGIAKKNAREVISFILELYLYPFIWGVKFFWHLAIAFFLFSLIISLISWLLGVYNSSLLAIPAAIGLCVYFYVSIVFLIRFLFAGISLPTIAIIQISRRPNYVYHYPVVYKSLKNNFTGQFLFSLWRKITKK